MSAFHDFTEGRPLEGAVKTAVGAAAEASMIYKLTRAIPDISSSVRRYLRNPADYVADNYEQRLVE